MTAYVAAMRNYGVFEGRMSPGDYWRFILVWLAIGVGATLLDRELGTNWKGGGGLCITLFHDVHLVPQLAAITRRLHDIDRSGWWYLIIFTGVGALVLVIWACLPGTHGPNRFGPVPVQAGYETTAVPASPTSAPLHHGRVDAIAEIERLGRLRREGHLSEAEFDVMKAEALAQGRRAPA